MKKIHSNFCREHFFWRGGGLAGVLFLSAKYLKICQVFQLLLRLIENFNVRQEERLRHEELTYKLDNLFLIP